MVLCACETPYQPDSFWRQGGYSEEQTGQASWVVTFRGNENTSMERSLDFSLMRAAKLCLINNYSHVEISHTESIVDAYEEEESVYETDEDGEEVEVDTRTYTVETPRAVREINCRNKPVNDNEGADSEVYDAAFLKQSIEQKYNF